MKKIYLLLLIILGLTSLAIYSTYAMFTTSVEIASTDTELNYIFKINSNQEFVVSANSKIKINAIVENDMQSAISYGIYYKMISPSNLPSEVTIAEITSSTTNTTSGSINANDNKTIPIAIINNSNQNITVEIGVRTGYSNSANNANNIIYNTNEVLITNRVDSTTAGTYKCDYINDNNCTEECYTVTENGYKNTYCDVVCTRLTASEEFTGYIASDYIESLLVSNPNTMNNDDPDNNVRYMGANPNNYVRFNNELWRIIGVFDVKSSVNGAYEKRLKIIRDESLGEMAWDSANTNNWTTASLQTYLNGDYYSSLTSEAQALIGDTYWNLGGTANYTSSSNGLASHFYGYERGTTVYSGRPTYWVGKIGLMYPSDYGYATSGGTTTNRASCLAKEMYNWDSLSDCYNNDYLYNSSSSQWTITPISNDSSLVFYVGNSGYVDDLNRVTNSLASRPVLYLKSTVEITGGDGTSGNPYIFLN